MAGAADAAGGSSRVPTHDSLKTPRSEGSSLTGKVYNNELFVPSADAPFRSASAGPSSPTDDRRTEIPPSGDAHAASNLGFIPNPNPKLQVLQDSLNNAPKQASYAKAVTYAKSSRPPPAFVSNLTAFHPVKRGNASFLKMPEDLYQRRLSAFTYALIGRIFLPKQSPPRPLPDLKSELQGLFKTVQDWSLTPLGKGFFSLKFSSQEDHVCASRYNSWKLKSGSFFLREWKPNFDPYKERTSITQIWVRLFHLPEEYWDPNFLVGIFRAVGNVVKLDGSTAAGTVGHFARALVEIDLSYPLAESVTIEGCSSTFVVEFGFENLPLYCSFCKYIGHSFRDCKSKRKREDDAKEPPGKPPENPKTKAPRQVDKPAVSAPNQKTTKETAWQPKQVDTSATVSTSNAFAALENDNPDSGDPSADASLVRELVPLSAEAAAALQSIAGRDYTLHIPETENVLSSDEEEEEEIQADIPPKAADASQPNNTSPELTFHAAGLELSPNGSAMPSKTAPTDMDKTTMVVPPPGHVEGHRMSAAAKRRTKEALRKGRVRSSIKTRSSFDRTSDTLHVLADRRGKSAHGQAASVGLPHGAKRSQLDNKICAAMEQGICPKPYVVDTGQPAKAMGFIANQRWGDVLDLAVTDKDFFDLMT